MYVYFNPNPNGNTRASDCVVRAISKLENLNWEETYFALMLKGYEMADMPNVNHVWGQYLYERGYKQYTIPNTCPRCYTVYDFVKDFPKGAYLAATGTHVIAVVDGDWYDTGDTGNEVITYFWTKENMA